MKYEWKKLLRSPLIPVLFFCLMLLNLWLFSSSLSQEIGRNSIAPDTAEALFAWDSGGYTLAQVGAKYHWSAESLEKENETLSQRLWSGGEYADETLVTGDIKYEQFLNEELLRRKDATQNYLQNLSSLRADMHFKLHTGIFGELNNFSKRSLEDLDAQYAELTDLQLPDTFAGSVEAISDWQLSDALLLLFGLSTGLLLLTQEHANGQMILLHPTKKGRAPLYQRKYGAMLCVVLLGFFLLHGTNFLLAGETLGYCDLSIPIQTVYGFSACAEKWTVLQYLLAFYGQKLLWTIACCTLLFCVCAAWKKPALVCVFTAVLVALAVWVGSSLSFWLCSLSLTRMTDTKAYYQSCTYLNFFGNPIRRSIATPIILCLITLGSFVCGLLLFCKLPAVSASKHSGRRYTPIPKRTSLFMHEGRKVFLTNGALVLLILFTLFQTLTYANTTFPKGEWETYYARYSETLNGERTPQKDEFLLREEEGFEALKYKLAQLEAAAGEDDGLLTLLSQDITAKLRPQDAFEAAKKQYRSLKDGQRYVYATGYTRLFERDAIKTDLGDTAKLIVALTLACSALFAAEYETGVIVLQTTAGARKKVLRRKLLLAAVVTLLFVVVAYTPRFVRVWQCFGLPELDAQANSLIRFSWLPNEITLRGLLIAVAAIRLLLAEGITAFIALLSYKTKNTVTTILLSFGLLLLPFVLVALLL